MIFHFDPEGTLVDSVPTNLVDNLHSPIVQHGPPDSLGVNHPGIQSRIIRNDLVIIRYVDLGRDSAKDRYDWSYELYIVDPISGSSRFAKTFR